MAKCFCFTILGVVIDNNHCILSVFLSVELNLSVLVDMNKFKEFSC